MSDIQNVMDYIMNTPHNTNPAILKQQLEELSANGTGGTGGKSLYGLPYKCQLAYAGEIELGDNVEGVTIQTEVPLNDGTPFIVFCGDKIHDNKYFTCMGVMITTRYEDDEGHEKLGFCFSSTSEGDVYPQLSKLYNDSINLYTYSSDFGGSIEYKYFSSINSKHFLTIYAIEVFGQGETEETQLEIQLEDYIDSKLLPIPTIFSLFQFSDEYDSVGSNRSYEQVMNDIENCKLECYSNIYTSERIDKAICCRGSRIIFIDPSSGALQPYYWEISYSSRVRYSEDYVEGE